MKGGWQEDVVPSIGGRGPLRARLPLPFRVRCEERTTAPAPGAVRAARRVPGLAGAPFPAIGTVTKQP